MSPRLRPEEEDCLVQVNGPSSLIRLAEASSAVLSSIWVTRPIAECPGRGSKLTNVEDASRERRVRYFQSATMGDAMPQKRRRFKQQLSLQDRLAAWAKGVTEQAEQLPPGPERDALLKKTRQANTASHIEDWAHSPGLQPPK